MIFLAGGLLLLDPRLLAVRDVDLQPEDRQPRHLGPILLGAVVQHPPSSIDWSPLVLLTGVGRHIQSEWQVALLQVVTRDVLEHLELEPLVVK